MKTFLQANSGRKFGIVSIQKLLAFIAVVLLLPVSFATAQDAGLIFKPAGSAEGRLILDPGSTGNVLEGAGDFVIPFSPLPHLQTEPEGDPSTGASGGHTDLISGTDEGSPTYMYYDIDNEAVVFRVRLGKSSNASKGYSFLFNTDTEEFGPGDFLSDDNPGFQYEVALLTGSGIKLFNHMTGTEELLEGADAYMQKAVAEDGENVFYDFYVPVEELNDFNDFKVASTTVTSANSGASGTSSDISGIVDTDYNSPISALLALVESAPEVTLNTLDDMENLVPRTPSIFGPLLAEDNAISGSSRDIDNVRIDVYVNGVVQESTTSYDENNQWSITTDLDEGDLVYARAVRNGNESDRSTTQIVGYVNQCTVAPENFSTSGNLITGFLPGIEGVEDQDNETNLILRVYGPDGDIVMSTSADDAVEEVELNWIEEDDKFELSGSGNPFNQLADYYVTAQLDGECESTGGAGEGTQTEAPEITTETILESTTTVDGTAAAGATVYLYQGAAEIGSEIADGSGNWTITVEENTFIDNSQITARAQADGEILSDRSDIVFVGSDPPVIETTTVPFIVGTYAQNQNVIIEGYSYEADGTEIRVYVDGSFADDTTVDLFGNWQLDGVDLTDANTITATANAEGKRTSDFSEEVNVSSAEGITEAPEIFGGDSEVELGFSQIIGTKGEGTIRVYLNESELASAGSFPVTVSEDDINEGDEIYATNQATEDLESEPSNTVMVVRNPNDIFYIGVSGVDPDPVSGGGGRTSEFTFSVLNGTFEDADGVDVDFEVVDGDGVLSSTSGTTSEGDVSVTYTTNAADDESTVRVRADVVVDDDIIDSATASLEVGEAVVAGAADESESEIVAEPGQIIADGNATSIIKVTVKDGDGNIRFAGDDDVFLTTTTGTLSEVTDNGDGTYTATLTSSTDVETATVTGYLGTEDNDPEIGTATVEFAAGDLDNFLIETTEEGDINDQTAGETFNIRITARDANNHTVISFDKTVSLSLNEGNFEIGGEATGTFDQGVLESHEVRIDSAGTGYRIRATETDNEPTGDSNSFDVVSNTATQLVITEQPSGGEGLNDGSPAEIGMIILKTLDDFENHSVVGLSVPQKVTVSLLNDASGEDDASLNETLTHDIKSGTATFGDLTLNRDGEGFSLRFTSAGPPELNTIDSDPFNMTGVQDASGFDAALVQEDEKTAGESFSLGITEARGVDGDRFSDDVNVKVINEEEEPEEVHNGTVSFTDGAAEVQVTLTKAGNHTLTVDVAGVTGNETVEVTVEAAEISDSESSVEVDPDELTVGGESVVTITLRDGNGNLITGINEEDFEITLSGNDATLAEDSFTDAGEGEYTFEVTNNKAEQITVSVEADGVFLDDEPVITFTPGDGIALKTTAVVPDGTAGEETEITITVLDAEDNPVPGAEDDLDIGVSDGSANEGATFSEITDNGDGTYTVSYTPTTAGDDEITVELGEGGIDDSPFTSTVSAGAVFSFTASNPDPINQGQALRVELNNLVDAEGNTADGEHDVVVRLDNLDGYDEGDKTFEDVEFTGGNAILEVFTGGETSGLDAQANVELTAEIGDADDAFTVTVNDALAAEDGGEAIEDITLNVGQDVVASPDLNDVFAGGTTPYTYSVTSADEALVTAAIDGDELTVSGVAAGSAEITVTISDDTGAEVEQSFTVTVKPTIPTIATPGDNSFVNQEQADELTVSGTAEGSDNVRITISDGDNNTEEETVPVTDGDYGTDFDVSGLVDGELTIEVVGIAAGDNESGPADISVTKDTSVPALAVDDQTTNDTTPLITGTSDQAEGTEVTVTVDDEEYTAEVDADGNWSMEVTDELNDGEYVTEASITDEAGNTTADTATITIDTVDPVLTVNDLITNDTTPTITGTSDQAEGTEVTVTVDGQDYTVEVDANGDWSALVTEQLADGDYTVESSITDDVGNTTTETATITIDTENPLLTITDQITNNATPTITGTSDQPEGSEVTVTVNEQDYIAEVDSDGNWAITITTALDDGEYAIEASVTDEAGNTTIAPADVTIDTNEPALTVNDLTTNDTTPTITGTSDQPEGTEVTVTVDDEEYTAEVDADGNWAINITTTLDDGKYIVEVTITDDAGNTTTDTADLIIDTTEPVLTVTDQTTNNTTPMITGTSDQAEGTEVMVTVDDGDYTAEVDSEGNWSALVTEQLADSEYSVEGSIIDEAGNTTMETGELIIDTTEPALTATDQTTNNTTPTITGTSDQLGGIVGVTIDEQTYTGMVAENGTWSVEVTEELNDSEYMAEATITDEASNTTTDTATITVDTEEPLLSVNDQITKGATPTITGTSDQAEGAEVTVTVNGEDYSAEVDADGNWSVEVTEELNDGEFTTEATITDEAGNTTTESADLIINTTNPVINAIALAENTEEDAEYVEFEVTFSQKIDGFNLDEFLLTMTGNAQGNLSGFSGEGNIYTVSIDSIDGLGSLRLDFVYDDNSGIVDLAGNSIKQGFTGGDIHTVSSIGNIEMANSTVEVNPSTLSVKQAVTVTINLRDANKNPVSGLTYSEFALKFNEADAKTVEDSFEEIEAGVYAVDVTNENVEVVTITTTVFDVELDNQPEVTFTAGNADAFVIVSGDKQTQPTLSTLEDSLVVGISDQFGNPVEGERIVFTLETSPEFSWGSSFSRDTVLSNSSGLGTTAFRLGDEGGEYQIAAYAVEYPNLDTLVFTASANATRPDPSVIDTVNTVVFNGDMNTFMFAEPSETLNDLQSFAAEIWVLPNELAENYVLFDKEGDNDADKQFKIWGEDNKIFARINFENGSSTTLSADNIFETEAQEKQLAMKGSESIELLNSIEEKYKWTHLTFSVNDDEKRADLYKNGYRIDAVNFEGDVNTGNAELEMGRGYNGEIHEVRVWNAAINRSQVQSQMTQILTGTEDNLVFYHTFDDNGNTASDITGNANNLHLGEDVERQFSIRGIPNIEMSENDEYIMTFKGLDEYGNKLKSHITRLPSNGKLYQIKTGGTERGDEITSIPAELTDIENRALYVPNPYYNGTDELVFLLEDIYGNDASAPRQILIHEVHHTPDLNFASLAVEHRFISFDQRDTLSINLNDYVNDPDLENDPAKMSWGAKVLTDQLNPKITSETAANEKESNNVSDSISETERSIRETDTAKLQVHSVNETSDNPEFSYGTNGDNSPGQYTLTQQNAETGQKDSLIISINNNTKVATLTSTRNFDAENLPVLFTVTDPTDLSDTDTLFVTVHPVYDPPTRFAQLFPIEGDSIFVKETGNKQITFDWEPSISEEGKSIHYTFSLWNDKGEQESYSSISDTMLTLNMNKTMLEFDNSYTWLVEASDGIDTTQSMNQKHFHVVKEMPMIYSLLPNYPNPFNPETTITYYVPVESDVRITIYDILGREVQQLVNQNGHQGGHFETVWDARSLASGTYIYRMEAASVNGEHQFVNTKKMLLVK